MEKTEQKFKKILSRYGDMITSPNDLTAGEPPSLLFWLLADKLSYLMDADPVVAVSRKGVDLRRKLAFIIQTLGPRFLSTLQVFENRNFLRNPKASVVEPDPGITLPKEPVIWAANHGFKDDTLATVLAAQRHAYILFGSLPQFYNTVDGITAYLNGVVMVNRKTPVSRKTSIPKSVRVMEFGSDLLIFPEGIWNKSPNALALPLWPGIYRIACETGAKVVPIVHYFCECDGKTKSNPIHTVIDDPIRIDNLSEKAALECIRDTFATWTWLMMEVYGASTREESMRGATSSAERWEQLLLERISVVARYDREAECHADHRPKDILRPEDVWAAVASIEHITPQNAANVAYAQNLVIELRRQDFQRRL